MVDGIIKTTGSEQPLAQPAPRLGHRAFMRLNNESDANFFRRISQDCLPVKSGFGEISWQAILTYNKQLNNTNTNLVYIPEFPRFVSSQSSKPLPDRTWHIACLVTQEDVANGQDSYKTIADKYSTTVEDLKFSNDNRKISANTLIYIPLQKPDKPSITTPVQPPVQAAQLNIQPVVSETVNDNPIPTVTEPAGQPEQLDNNCDEECPVEDITGNEQFAGPVLDKKDYYFNMPNGAEKQKAIENINLSLPYAYFQSLEPANGKIPANTSGLTVEHELWQEMLNVLSVYFQGQKNPAWTIEDLSRIFDLANIELHEIMILNKPEKKQAEMQLVALTVVNRTRLAIRDPKIYGFMSGKPEHENDTDSTILAPMLYSCANPGLITKEALSDSLNVTKDTAGIIRNTLTSMGYTNGARVDRKFINDIENKHANDRIKLTLEKELKDKGIKLDLNTIMTELKSIGKEAGAESPFLIENLERHVWKFGNKPSQHISHWQQAILAVAKIYNEDYSDIKQLCQDINLKKEQAYKVAKTKNTKLKPPQKLTVEDLLNVIAYYNPAVANPAWKHDQYLTKILSPDATVDHVFFKFKHYQITAKEYL